MYWNLLVKCVQKVFATRHGYHARDFAVHVPNLMLVVAPAQGQGMGYSEPWRGLSKSEETADRGAVGGEMNWDAGFSCINSHSGSKYNTRFLAKANQRVGLMKWLSLATVRRTRTWSVNLAREQFKG